MSGYMQKEYKLPNGRTVTADFNELGCAMVTIQAMDALFDILNSSVEVVRCKDCIHNYMRCWNQGKLEKPKCRFTDYIRSNMFYCGFGERAES